MYKVVTERERWFNFVMGDEFKVESAGIEAFAERLKFPYELARELNYRIGAVGS